MASFNFNLDIAKIGGMFPSVQKPERKLTFMEKMKWTGIVLVLFYALGSIVVWGVDSAAIAHFQFLEIIFGSKFGSLITLGIGPIVTASIILQLLMGSKIINWNTNTKEGKEKFMGTQKVLAILFCIMEAFAYVLAGAVPASSPELVPIVIAQLILGGILIMFMDEVVSKWGIGSGISLFIAAGVSKTIFMRIFDPPLGEAGGGIIFNFISLLGQGQPASAIVNLFPLISTLAVFALVTYAQAMRVEIPMAFSLPFGKFGARKWPLKFIYTSNIPVILTSAVLANLQVIGKLLASKGIFLFGKFDASSGMPTGGLLYYLTAPNSVGLIVVVVTTGILAVLFGMFAKRTFKKFAFRFSALGTIAGAMIGFMLVSALNIPEVPITDIIRTVTYLFLMVLGSVVFSIFWVATSGMDAKSVAGQFESSSIMIPGFRRDPRIIERILERYIPALTVLGGAFVGLLAGFADLTNALGTGTGILLTVMIVYQLYEQIISQHWDEIPPFIRKYME